MKKYSKPEVHIVGLYTELPLAGSRTLGIFNERKDVGEALGNEESNLNIWE